MKIVYMGTPDFAVLPLRALAESDYEIAAVVTQPDKPQGRKQILVAPPVKEKALELGIPVEAIAAGGVADEGEKVLAPQIIDPGQRSRGRFDHVFFLCVVKKTVSHVDSPYDVFFTTDLLP